MPCCGDPATLTGGTGRVRAIDLGNEDRISKFEPELALKETVHHVPVARSHGWRDYKACLYLRVKSINSSAIIQVRQFVTSSLILINEPSSFLSFTGKTPSYRLDFRESTDLFANIHTAATVSGEIAVPDELNTFTYFLTSLGSRRA